MSGEASFEEFDNDTEYLLNVSASSDESENVETNISPSEPDSSEVDKTSLRKDSEDLFKSGSDIDKTASESYSEGIEIGINSLTFVKGTIEDVFEVEETVQDADENNFELFNKKLISDKSQQYVAEVVNTSTSGSDKETEVDLSNVEQDRDENNAEQSTIVSDKSSKLSTADLIGYTMKPSSVTTAEDVFKDEVVEQDGTGNKSKAYGHAEQSSTASNKSPQSPTGAMKSLSISDSPNSKSKSTPRSSRFKANKVNIFDSPYNTRLKARMLKDREMQSRNKRGPTDE